MRPGIGGELMGIDYQAALKAAQSGIKDAGRQAVLIRSTVSGDAWAPSSTDAEHPCWIVVTAFRQNLVDGTRIKSTDKRVLVSPEGLTIEPCTSDRLKIGAETFAIVNAETVKPADTVLLFKLQVRE